MQTVFEPKFTLGIFKKELKNRFLCEVDIDGANAVCYVPSSCHLSNFLKLDGKRVLLTKTKTKGSRTEYALFAVKYKRSYIILNTSLANIIVKNSLNSRRFSYLGKRRKVYKEYFFNDYKCDLYIEDTNTIIEIKSVISAGNTAVFPTVFSERSIRQFKKIYDLLTEGVRVHYMIVSLSPYVKNVRIETESLFYEMLKKCIDLGMTLAAFSCRLKEEEVMIQTQLPIIWEE